MTDIRKEYDEAERLYHKALELDPDDANNTANYIGILLCNGRWDEGRRYAKDIAEALIAGDTTQVAAEILFYRVLLSAKQSEDPRPELARIKTLLAKGFKRGSWSFAPHLEAVEPFIDDDKLKFYRAVADAILDEERVSDLEAFSEWRDL